jgi:hypothetical protein
LYSVRGRFAQDRISLDTTSVFRSVQIVSDVNGDSVSDLVVSGSLAPSSLGANDEAGLARVISGASGAVLYDVAGGTSDGRLNFVPLGFFDFTNDGISELIFRSVRGDSTALVNDNIGRIRVVNGATGTMLYEVLGTFSNDGIPTHLGITDDITGDGIVDFFFASTTSDSAQAANDDVGRLSFINGASGQLVSSTLGAVSGDSIGNSSFYSGSDFDVDQDGHGDVLLFSNVQDADVGSAVVNKGGVTAVSAKTGLVAYKVFGNFPGDGLATAVRPASDVNGDGVNDFFMASPFADSGENLNDDVGYIGLYSGASGGKMFELFGGSAGDQISLGGSVVIDVNNDGLFDRVVGASSADSPSAADAGQIMAIVSDQCPDDAVKTVPGICGCGVADTDSDGDAILDCQDACPADSLKAEPGVCGCGFLDADQDGDGMLDCQDGCPADSLKTVPGVCGCGVVDSDTNGNSIVDCDKRDGLLVEVQAGSLALSNRLSRGTLKRKFLRNRANAVLALLNDVQLTFPGDSASLKQDFLVRLSKVIGKKALLPRAEEQKAVSQLGRRTVALFDSIEKALR